MSGHMRPFDGDIPFLDAAHREPDNTPPAHDSAAPPQTPTPPPPPPTAPPPPPPPADSPPNTSTETGGNDSNETHHGGRIAAMRAAAEQASIHTEGDTAELAAAAQLERKLTEQERLYGHVDRVLGLVSSDAHLNNLASNFTLTKDPAVDKDQRNALEQACGPKLHGKNIYFESVADARLVFDLVYDELLGISILGDLWRDDDVSEICIDAWDRISAERNGNLITTGYRFRSPEHGRGVIRALSRKMSDRQVSPTNPLVTAQLPAARVQFVYGDLSSTGMAITIRKFKPLMGMDGLLGVGALTNDMRDFLAACVQARATILVSGGTGTGKTTMINALSEFIPDTERVITIEDAFELQLSNTHWVALQAKQRASADDTVEISQADLMVACLRMRPDRIVVGEIREPSAAAVMFDAANTGHDGTMTTIHADTPYAALNNRLTVLLMRAADGFSESVARRTVAQTIQLVVQISRSHGRRFVSEISLVDDTCTDANGMVHAQPIFIGQLERVVGANGPTVHVHHRRIASVGAHTVLGAKLAETDERNLSWVAE